MVIFGGVGASNTLLEAVEILNTDLVYDANLGFLILVIFSYTL